MDAVLNWLWQGAIVAMALFGLLRLLDRARANVRYAVCWVALLLVIALPLLSSLADRAPLPEVLPGALADLSEGAIVSMPNQWWTSGAVIAVAWAAWAIVCSIRFTWAMVALRRARARCRPFPASVEQSLPCWRRVRHDGRRPVLALSDAVSAAAVLGGGTPVIAVAPSLVARLEADELDRVVIHEWAHVQRRDDLVSVLQVFLRVVAGWHPASWWIERRLHIEREIACDETTVAIAGSPKLYATCLVKLATVSGAERTMLPVPAALRASGLRARVTRIVARRAFITPAWSRGLAAAVVSVLCGVSLAAGDFKLVGAAALSLPLEAIRVPGIRIADVAPMAPPATPVRQALASRATESPAAPAPQHQTADTGNAATASPGSETQPPSDPSPAPAATEVAPPVDSGGGLAAATEPLPAPVAQPPDLPVLATEQSRSPWTAAADPGVAIGRKSKEAGLATAGFFTRTAKRVAGAF